MMNVLNGGKHADNNIDAQEFLIIPSNDLIVSRFLNGENVQFSPGVFVHFTAGVNYNAPIE